MGLIEKAFAANNDVTKPSADVEKQERFDRAASELRQGSTRGASSVCRRQFDMDLARLARHGFYVPDEKATQLALELRLLKRRLLRRLGFLRSQNNPEALGRRPQETRNRIMVTSTRPAEGKTFTSINLALSLALEDDIEVVLADADAPRPKVQSFFGLSEPHGFTDLIMDPQRSFHETGVRARQAPLTILPEGSSIDHPGDLFGTAQAQKVVNDIARSNHDQIVIFDAPPVLATTEAVILAPFVDEILFVVEADTTPEQAIASAIEELLDVNPNVSLILNKCLIGAGGSHYGSYQDYYPRGKKHVVPASKAGASKKRPERGKK